MGLFREFGRQVEQVKQSVTESVEDGENSANAEDTEPGDDGEGTDDADFECTSCGARFDTHEGECPECWSSEITPLAE